MPRVAAPQAALAKSLGRDLVSLLRRDAEACHSASLDVLLSEGLGVSRIVGAAPAPPRPALRPHMLSPCRCNCLRVCVCESRPGAVCQAR